MSSIKKLCLCGIFIALCYVLPLAFHMVGLGSVLSPLHIPVLLCGMVCGGWYGLACGAIGPVLSSLLSGMPPAVGLISMVPELMIYGFVSGLCMRFVRTGKLWGDLYISLAASMLLGRVVGGVAKALFYLGKGNSFGISAWVSAYFVTSAPAIALHLVLIPVLVVVLEKAGAMKKRY